RAHPGQEKSANSVDLMPPPFILLPPVPLYSGKTIRPPGPRNFQPPSPPGNFCPRATSPVPRPPAPLRGPPPAAPRPSAPPPPTHSACSAADRPPARPAAGRPAPIGRASAARGSHCAQFLIRPGNQGVPPCFSPQGQGRPPARASRRGATATHGDRETNTPLA